MILYTVPIAPNPTKLALYLAERKASGSDIELEQVVVNLLQAEQRGSAHLARNPFGTLPVLELDDGSHLIESLSIIQYLENQFPKGALLPADPLARAKASQVERIADQRVGIHLIEYVHATRSPLGRPRDEMQARSHFEAMQEPLAFLEDLLSDGRPFLTGKQASLADCTMAALVGFARAVRLDVIDSHSALTRWFERYLARDHVQKILAHANLAER